MDLNQRGYLNYNRQRLRSFDYLKPYELVYPSHQKRIPTTFISLPTEIRLQIYSYITNDDRHPPDKRCPYLHDEYHDHLSASAGKYAYLYRSPGRLVSPYGFSRDVIKLFHICRQVRDEMIDVTFSGRRFVLEASLYQSPVGGLKVAPSNLVFTSFVERLLLITVLELDGRVRGIGDLRAIQEMTNLKELQIIFVAKSKRKAAELSTLDLTDSPIKAVLECVPESTRVQIGMGATTEAELCSQLGPSIGYLFEKRHQENTATVLERIALNMDRLGRSKGRLSGSEVNHSCCQYSKCLEGLGCLNSTFNKPISLYGVYPAPKVLFYGYDSDEDYRYPHKLEDDSLSDLKADTAGRRKSFGLSIGSQIRAKSILSKLRVIVGRFSCRS